MQKFLEKNYKLLVTLTLSFMAIVSLLNAWWDSAIFDEKAHIPAGYSYLTKHEIRLNPEHPPLLKDLTGFPLLFLNLNFNTENQPFWEGTLPGKWDEGQWKAGQYLLFEANNNPDKIIFWARFPIVVLSLLLGWFIFKWTRELAGISAGLFALLLYAFDPNILGHNHFVTTDLGIAAFMTFAFYYYLKFIKFPSWKNVTFAGIFTGLLMLTKFSFFTALPVFLLTTILYPLVLLQRSEEKKGISFRLKKLGEYTGKGAIIVSISLVLIWIVYAINTFDMTREVVSQSIDNNFSPSDTTSVKNVYTNKILHSLNNQSITRPFVEFGIGIGYVFRRVSGGNGAYFMGQVSGNAFPAYFPVVFLLKEPLPNLLFMLFVVLLSFLGIFKSLNNSFRLKLKDKLATLASYIRHNIVGLSLVTFIALYSYVSITGNLNIGFRHLFPILPFIYILTSKIIFDFLNQTVKERQSKFVWGLAIILLLIILISSTLANYPYYMSYFNKLAGGPRNGYQYVTDSNADWGQDLKRLKVFLREHPEIQKIRVNYFGGADVAYYLGDKYTEWWDSKRPIEPGWYAISTNYLMGSIYDKEKKDEDSYRWLKNIKPVYQVGTAILIYNVTEKDVSLVNK